MAHSPLTLSRRHVLGDLYAQCEPLESVPVYWNDLEGSEIGFVDQSTGDYADAFTFHMGEEFCRKLAAGQILCHFNYEFAGKAAKSVPRGKGRIRLTSFVLLTRKGYEKPISKLLSEG